MMPEGATTPIVKVPRKRRRPQISCTECRRRKQKCKARTNGPCENCLRRYPPVHCYVDENAHRREEIEHQPSSTIALQQSFRSSVSNPSSLGLPEIGGNTQREHATASEATPADHPESLASNLNASDLIVYYPRVDQAISGYSSARSTPSPSSQAIGGMIAAVNSSLTDASIDPTLRNAELFHRFHQKVISSMTSIDGSHTPQIFLQEILPWMLQSHIMPHIAILMASAEQSADSVKDMKRKSETIAIKSKVLGLFNEFLDNDFLLVGNAAIRAIFPLVTTEFLWGDINNLSAHMRGLKQMVKMKGGLDALTDPVLQHALTVTDYQLACYLEQNVFLQTLKEGTCRIVNVSPSYSPTLCSPLVDHPKRFADLGSKLGLDDLSTKILDDVRFLTLSLLNAESSAEQLVKIRATAEWLYTRLSSSILPPLTPPSLISNALSHMIHLTAKVFTSSIKNMTPLSDSFTSSMHEEFHSFLALIPKTLWKDLPGIWYWILLVICPSGEKMGQRSLVAAGRAKWFRRRMAVAGTAIAFADFGLGTLMVQRFWLVQQWIESGKKSFPGSADFCRDSPSSW
ncbi:hypothetical protein ONS95_006609 [Cadophora gregata]|uniref:uncharacterized protein n=1 Tax=Cadophora gregata TaxID=51156 RepID=UPI0026DC6CE3|nr:uncharacterized protein ONS95_006609 [Cadophora gregata]KAK0101436.1 hypothetical protein ONS95_006609 [Cadophora gregata]